jgi:hypothetical protein
LGFLFLSSSNNKVNALGGLTRVSTTRQPFKKGVRMSDLDKEFLRFKTQLFAELDRLNERAPPEIQAKLRAELQRFEREPKLRESFVRDVFANNKKLPDVQNIRSRLRRRSWQP